MKRIYVGIKESKRTLDVCLKVPNKEQYFKIENKPNRIKNF